MKTMSICLAAVQPALDGSRFEYSNSGFVILGAVIDRVSGQSYYDYVRDQVYTPARMTSTALSEPKSQPVPGLSLSYTKLGGNGWHTDRNFPPFRETAAVGGADRRTNLQIVIRSRYKTSMPETPQAMSWSYRRTWTRPTGSGFQALSSITFPRRSSQLDKREMFYSWRAGIRNFGRAQSITG